MQARKRVVFVSRALMHYRIAFHEQVRERLAACGVDYQMLYGNERRDEAAKGDTVDIAWATKLPVSYFGRSEKLCWQHGVLSRTDADLVILVHENSLLVNYPIIVGSWLSRRRVAFFGHGRGFQAASPNGLAERFKRFWASKVDWWFAYTSAGKTAVMASGFPGEWITVFNNAMDTSAIRQSVARLDPRALAKLRADLVGGSENVAVYVGGIYAQKRIGFLLNAAKRIREMVPDFHLVVIGAGVDAHLVEAAAAEHSWIHYVGPKFGDEKTGLVKLARVFLMPGLVGLAVLDAFAYGTPMVTTDLPFHSPEIAYLEDSVNGVIVPDSDDIGAYASAVTRILQDEAWRSRLEEGGQRAVEFYTIENMAERFAQGVLQALEA
jgi:glycosyltransferase involved in cell wall biosynthesis